MRSRKDWLTKFGKTQITYDIVDAINGIVDEDSVLGKFMKTMQTICVVGFAESPGEVCGVGVGNQPQSMAGVLDTHGSTKAARSILYVLCDKFSMCLCSSWLMCREFLLPRNRSRMEWYDYQWEPKLLYAFLRGYGTKDYTWLPESIWGATMSWWIPSISVLRFKFCPGQPQRCKWWGQKGASEIISKRKLPKLLIQMLSFRRKWMSIQALFF